MEKFSRGCLLNVEAEIIGSYGNICSYLAGRDLGVFDDGD
jgi:hypothetical protein